MSRFRDSALAIGEALADAGDAAIGWSGDTLVGPHEDAMTLVHAPAGHDLYSGSAGIGWFLAHLARASGSAAGATAAARAIEAALGAGEAMIARGELSLYGGAAGVALAATEAADALDRAELCRAGLALGASVAAASRDWVTPENDLIGGLAGVIVALLALDRRSPVAAGMAAAADLCERLLARGRTSWWGTTWPGPSGVALCGLGHGASGIGWALMECASRRGDARLMAAAHAALRYERASFAPDRASWPDLRPCEADGAAEPAWMDAWCHGAFGIGAVRWRWWEEASDPAALAQAGAAMWAARRDVAQAGAALPAGIPDVTLCHGLAGAAELMLLAFEATGRDEHRRAARRVGDLMLRAWRDNGERWTTGLREARDVPGLFLGRAGIGVTMLRLDDPAAIGSPMLAGRPAWRGVAPVRS